MPISAWNMRKCKVCGKLFYNCMGDCISASDLMIMKQSVCGECLNKRRSKGGEGSIEKKGFTLFNS